MPAEKGSMYSKNPLRDRQDDERAVDLRIADALEVAARVLRSRQPQRVELAQLIAAKQQESASPLERRSA